MLPEIPGAKEVIDLAKPLLGSPSKELSEFVADRVRFWRWKSAVKILKLAREIRDREGISQGDVPLKLFLPFIEEASKERENDDEIMKLWARLLASSSERTTGFDIICVELLKSIGSKEAEIMSNVAYFHHQMKNRKSLHSSISNELYHIIEHRPRTIGKLRKRLALEAALVGHLRIPAVTIYKSETDFSRENAFSISTLERVELCQINNLVADRIIMTSDQEESRRISNMVCSFLYDGEVSPLISQGISESFLTYMAPTKIGVLFMKRCGLLN